MTKIIRLSNRARITCFPQEARDSLCVGIWIGTGARYEKSENKGIAHFLEHLVFKGSKNYSIRQIKLYTEGLGAEINGFTTQDSTCYYMNLLPRHLSKAFDVLQDMLIRPLLKEEDIEKEKNVVIEEIKMHQELPNYYIEEMLDSMLWPKFNLGEDISGTIDSVKRINKKDLVSFHRKFYNPSNIVVAAAGNIDVGSFSKLVSDKLTRLQPSRKSSFRRFGKEREKETIRCLNKNIPQTHLGIGFLGLSRGHPDRYVMKLLSLILGGNMSSRLFNEIREKRGYVYRISTHTKSYQDTGAFVVRADIDSSRLSHALRLTMKELKRISAREVGRGELKQAKEYMLSQFLMSMEDNEDRMLYAGDNLLHTGKIRTKEEIIKEVEGVTSSRLKNVAKNIFEQPIKIALAGPSAEDIKKSIKKILNH